MPFDGTWVYFIIIGLLAGGLAKAIMPGRDPGGLIVQLAIGVVGALIGGWIADDVLGLGAQGTWLWELLVSTLGAVILLWVYRLLTRRAA
jgi:uncharacterized membrane protein YeaQ/YmgE (transglycosylase-associated protein family)